MVSRILAIAIVAFWLVMTGLLVRLEISPEKSAVLNVPVSHVLKLIFMHGQRSVLNIKENGNQAGTVALHPSSPTSDRRSLEFLGSMTVRLPMLAPQRFAWNGEVNLDRALRTQDFTFELSSRQSNAYRVVLTGSAAERAVRYELHENGQLVGKGKVPLDENIAPMTLQQLGFDPNVLANLRKNVSPPAVTARQAELRVRDEKIDVYQVTIRQGNTAMADIFVSQLGQVLMAKTPFGYTLSAEDLK